MTTPVIEAKSLTPFEGDDVIGAKIEIPDAAGGPRDALAVDPVELHRGDERHIILHCRVKKIRFDPADKAAQKRYGDDAVVRVHVLETLEAAFIESDDVAEYVRDNALRVKLEVERLAGIMHLGDEASDPDEAVTAEQMVGFHDQGLHHGTMVEGCPACADKVADREDDQRSRADLD